MMGLSQPAVRSIMAKGNGAYIVHAELAKTLKNYELLACNPYLGAIPSLPAPGLRKWLCEAQVAHLSPSYGHVPLPKSTSRVLTFHSFDINANDMEQASKAQRFYYKNVLRHAVIAATKSADRLIAVSRFVADCVRQHCVANAKSVEVIYNGIDTERFRPTVDENCDRSLRVLFVGNPSQRKGFHLLAGIAEQLPEDVELAFTSGLRNKEVKTFHKRLISLGHVAYSEMHRLYQQADILLFPAYREGFGLCIAEAMACGLPVVSSNCSAIPELIDEGQGGFLVTPGDIEAMLKKTRILLANPALRSDFGKWNRARALRDFDRSRMAEAYSEIFASLP